MQQPQQRAGGHEALRPSADLTRPRIDRVPSRDRVLHRNEAFQYSRQPLKYHPVLRLDSNHVTGPLWFFNPTTALFRSTRSLEDAAEALKDPIDQRIALPKEPPVHHHQQLIPAAYKWTSRNNRKGRHAITIKPTRKEEKDLFPPVTSSIRQVCRGLLRMVTEFPIWDISYDVAIIFTIGSIIWVINCFFAWLPLVRPDTEFHNEELYGGGITAFIGATVFEIGSFFLIAEAINENRTGCFGWGVEKTLSHPNKLGYDPEYPSSNLRCRPAKRSRCTHHHAHRGKLVTALHECKTDPCNSHREPRSWIWIPSKRDLLDHHLHDLGFLASLSQLIGASIFWIAGLTALPGIYNHLPRLAQILVFWTPQVVGGTGFIISGFLFMVETQRRWYIPAFGTLGWHIGFWNLVGGIGFTLCPAFGYKEASWAQYQSGLSTFWGSWAFLIGSVIQWYESLEKHPVEIDKG